jgi:hypothetical protein
VVVEDVAWAIRRVSRFVPRATCLTQAVAGRLMLARRGHTSRVNIGVARAAGGGLRAHAWLESDGVVVIGGDGLDDYTPLRGAHGEMNVLDVGEPHDAGEQPGFRREIRLVPGVETGARRRGGIQASRLTRHSSRGDQ